MIFSTPAANHFLHLCNCSSYSYFGQFPQLANTCMPTPHNFTRAPLIISADSAQHNTICSEVSVLLLIRLHVPVSKHTHLYYITFTPVTHLRSNLLMSAACIIVPTLNHAIYQPSRRQYVAANPTLPYPSLVQAYLFTLFSYTFSGAAANYRGCREGLEAQRQHIRRPIHTAAPRQGRSTSF